MGMKSSMEYAFWTARKLLVSSRVTFRIGEFSLGEFPDDKYRSNLETLLYQVKPQEIIYEKGNLSPFSLTLIKNIASLAALKSMQPNFDYWSGHQVTCA